MSDDESRHDLPTEGGAIFAENGSETVEEDQTGSTFMDSSINSTDDNSTEPPRGDSNATESRFSKSWVIGTGSRAVAVDGAENEQNIVRILHNLWLFPR